MNSEKRNPGDPIENLAIGKIIEVDGSHVIAELDSGLTELSRVYAGEAYPIGQFGSIVRIHFGRRLIYALVGRLRMKAEYEAERGLAPNASPDERIVEADLFGEGEWTSDAAGKPRLKFERGVATYPLPQQTVYLTPKSELRFIYGHGTGSVIRLGEHVGSGGAPCFADMNELLGKHTAVLGSTGSGKSGAVAAIIHSILERGKEAGYASWTPQIVILDPHNEYGKAFPEKDCKRLSTDEGTLSLPYWLLDLDETIGLLLGKTEHAATSQSNIVKNALLTARMTAARDTLHLDPMKLTVDSPIPYIIGDPSGLDVFGELGGTKYGIGFVGAINAQRPANKNKNDHEDYNKVLRKLDSLIKDERLAFMMRPWDGANDPFPGVLSQLLGDGGPLRIVDVSGVPNEVAGTASAAIARTLFSLKVWQTVPEREASPVLLVCEEAHRYVPNSGAAQYEAAQEAIRRVAKEGRKYGIGLMLVSQRPSEVEATVLSQCNSWIVLRITNESDREHVRGMLPDSMAGLTKMLSGLRRQEAIFVGQAAMLPSRIMIRDLSPDQLPKSNDIDFDKGWQSAAMSEEQIKVVANRWRYQKR
ncbi:MAG: ATP-binding protein [Candidatus Binatus sp.]|uniref:ATP-binding protein n=1 Tax=Candidatus Binatus sp. TaxID=2811406 RepID=UPI002719E48F|nr:ATP-binding protein [Candidatus Binatus sp.]MDO8434128.1 ATP-binding protein [Candidatus Binatus sp.]